MVSLSLLFKSGHALIDLVSIPLLLYQYIIFLHSFDGMDTSVSPTTSRSFHPSSSSSGHKFSCLSRSDFWFIDGNIILIAGQVAFKVHRGQLERHSEVFSDLFSIPQPKDQELFDDCLWVELHDCPSDVFYFLSALYDGL